MSHASNVHVIYRQGHVHVTSRSCVFHMQGRDHVTCRSCACHMFMYLSLCVHDADCVCPIAYNELIRDFGQVMHSIHCHILLPGEGGFEGVRTLCGLHVPELSCMGGKVEREGERGRGRREGERESQNGERQGIETK